MTPRRAYIGRSDPSSPRSLGERIGEALQHLKVERFVSGGGRVYLKPNLTYPFYKQGVTTSPAFVEAVLAGLRQWTGRLTVVESDGGANAWRAEEAFDGHGLPEICRRYGARCANLSSMPRERASTEIAGREVTVELASPALHECDLFITLPVPKVHVMTHVSLAFKNQWGCLPDARRLRNHPQFPRKILAINKLLRTRIALFDGTFFLDRTGPMDGSPVEMNLVVGADDPGVGSRLVCELMGIDPAAAPHKKLAMKAGMMPRSLDGVEINADPAPFRTHLFTLNRTLLNYVTLGAFRSSLATWFVYNSAFAKPIHELLYLIRGRPKDVAPYW